MAINLTMLIWVFMILLFAMAIGGSCTYLLAKGKTKSMKGVVTIGCVLTLCLPALLLLFVFLLFQPKLEPGT